VVVRPAQRSARHDAREVDVHVLVVPPPCRPPQEAPRELPEPPRRRAREHEGHILWRNDDLLDAQTERRRLRAELREQQREVVEVDAQIAAPPLCVELEAVTEQIPRPGRDLGGLPFAIAEGHEDVDAQPVLVAPVRLEPAARGPARLPEHEAPTGPCGRAPGEDLTQEIAHSAVHILPPEARAQVRIGDVAGARRRYRVAVGEAAAARAADALRGCVVVEPDARVGNDPWGARETETKREELDRATLQGAGKMDGMQLGRKSFCLAKNTEQNRTEPAEELRACQGARVKACSSCLVVGGGG
jgi:hypothetical protein